MTWSFDDSQPRFRHEKWRQVFEKQLASTPFTIQSADPLFSLPLGEASEEFTCWLSPEAIWNRYYSMSQVSVLRGEALTVGENRRSTEAHADMGQERETSSPRSTRRCRR